MAEWSEYPDAAERVDGTGTLRVLRGLVSPELDNERDIVVLLPASHGRTRRRYPVVYMHDGQNLFDDEAAFGDAWGVGRTMGAAGADGLEAIVVGIPNMGDARLDEYSPWSDRRHRAGGRGGAYLDFVIRTLKPIIDADFLTLPDREHTGIAGSSMGGLISLYAFFRHPRVFGSVAAMSPALWFGGRSIFPFVAERPFAPGRVYLDVGTNEGREALHDVRRMKESLVRKGYRVGRELAYVVEMGGRHDERAWARRLGPALHHMLGVPVRRQLGRPRGVELL